MSFFFFLSYIKKQKVSFIFLNSPFLIWGDRCVSKAAAPGPTPQNGEEARRQQLNALKVNENTVQCRHCPSDAVWRIHGRAAGVGGGEAVWLRGLEGGEEERGRGEAMGARTENVKSLQISAA